jgi:hypothetical protein
MSEVLILIGWMASIIIIIFSIVFINNWLCEDKCLCLKYRTIISIRTPTIEDKAPPGVVWIKTKTMQYDITAPLALFIQSVDGWKEIVLKDKDGIN